MREDCKVISKDSQSSFSNVPLYENNSFDSDSLSSEFLLWLSVSLRTQVQSLTSLIELRIQHCCKQWYKLQMLLLRDAVASDLIQCLPWELLYATGTTIKRKKKKKIPSPLDSVNCVMSMLFTCSPLPVYSSVYLLWISSFPSFYLYNLLLLSGPQP